jgi:hypothetical protein
MVEIDPYFMDSSMERRFFVEPNLGKQITCDLCVITAGLCPLFLKLSCAILNCYYFVLLQVKVSF